MNAPAPLRLAAGLAVTAAEEAFRLPYRLRRAPARVAAAPGAVADAGASAAGRAGTRVLARALRVQQNLSALAAKGDEALADLVADDSAAGAEAVFDDDPGAGVRATTAEQTALAVGYPELDADGLEDLLPELDRARIAALLDYELAHGDRPAFTTLLGNALAQAGS
ncbi:hypothetical protein CSPHI_08890 [Corynebacterium sphenisci DSM 44792]|uniref:Lipid droplet-associated protein n=1 Tax=Corynebacterium sphenisci DSM 44792 TaxID=1437874 RepID=A0A1L7CZ98_9CORY|nr:hypothetical protein [Corynebacterium sphenisci]APT91113.1 hypothetical protein CSPHI_08890 [Corynebacterium sphenisci DSM 44792]